MVKKSPNAFRTISEVADVLEVPAHVLRFWESKFSQIKPVKRSGGRRYYRPTDVNLIRGIRGLLYSDGLTIKGVQKVLREKGVKHVMNLGSDEGDLWGEPDGNNLEQAPKKPIPAPPKSIPPAARDEKSPELFELAEAPAAPPVQHKPRFPDTPPVHTGERRARKRTTLDPDIRSLFDDPEPSPAAKKAVSEDELINKIAAIAASERGDVPTPDKKAQIKNVLGRLETLRDRMKTQ